MKFNVYVPGDWNIHFHQLWHFLNNSKCTQGSFLANVGVAGLEKLLNVWGQVSGHVGTGDAAQGTQGQPRDELVGAVQVNFQVVCDQSLNFLILIQKQHGAQVSYPFVCKLGAGY